VARTFPSASLAKNSNAKRCINDQSQLNRK